VEVLKSWGHDVVDVGAHDESAVDYPDFAEAAAREVVEGRCERAVVVCGSGIGACISANKVAGIRAAHCHDPYSAQLSRAHNDANAIALGARMVGPAMAAETVRVWLETPFEGGRHQRRIDKISALEK